MRLVANDGVRKNKSTVVKRVISAGDKCIQCGETRAAIKEQKLFCATETNNESGREIDMEWPRHRFVSYSKKELAQQAKEDEEYWYLSPHCKYPMNRGIIRRMLKTFLQRWWIINRLHRFCVENGGIVWANEKRFIAYLQDIVTNKIPNTIVNPIRFPYSWIGEIKDDLLLHQKITNLIDECSDSIEGIAFILKGPNDENKPYEEHTLRLTALGRDRLVIWFITYRIESVLPKDPAKIQVEYVQPTTSKVSTSSSAPLPIK